MTICSRARITFATKRAVPYALKHLADDNVVTCIVTVPADLWPSFSNDGIQYENLGPSTYNDAEIGDLHTTTSIAAKANGWHREGEEVSGDVALRAYAAASPTNEYPKPVHLSGRPAADRIVVGALVAEARSAYGLSWAMAARSVVARLQSGSFTAHEAAACGAAYVELGGYPAPWRSESDRVEAAHAASVEHQIAAAELQVERQTSGAKKDPRTARQVGIWVFSADEIDRESSLSTGLHFLRNEPSFSRHGRVFYLVESALPIPPGVRGPLTCHPADEPTGLTVAELSEAHRFNAATQELVQDLVNRFRSGSFDAGPSTSTRDEEHPKGPHLMWLARKMLVASITGLNIPHHAMCNGRKSFVAEIRDPGLRHALTWAGKPPYVEGYTSTNFIVANLVSLQILIRGFGLSWVTAVGLMLDVAEEEAAKREIPWPVLPYTVDRIREVCEEIASGKVRAIVGVDEFVRDLTDTELDAFALENPWRDPWRNTLATFKERELVTNAEVEGALTAAGHAIEGKPGHWRRIFAWFTANGFVKKDAQREGKRTRAFVKSAPDAETRPTSETDEEVSS